MSELYESVLIVLFVSPLEQILVSFRDRCVFIRKITHYVKWYMTMENYSTMCRFVYSTTSSHCIRKYKNLLTVLRVAINIVECNMLD